MSEEVLGAIRLRDGVLFLTSSRLILAKTGTGSLFIGLDYGSVFSGAILTGLSKAYQYGKKRSLENLDPESILAKNKDNFAVSKDAVVKVEVGKQTIQIFANRQYEKSGQWVYDNEHQTIVYPLSLQTERAINQSSSEIDLLCSVLPGKVFIKMEIMTVENFCNYLRSSGIEANVASVVKTDPVKGMIKLESMNTNCVIKDVGITGSSLTFIVENIQGNVKGRIGFKEQHNNHQGSSTSDYIFDGKDTRFVSILNQDAELNEKLIKEIKLGNMHNIWITQSNSDISVANQKQYRSGKRNHIDINVLGMHNVPSKSFLQAVDRIAFHARSLRSL